MKVAVYCRVSTDQADQANSLENQKTYFDRYIREHPDWSLAKLYVDEGITGTSTKKRRAFNEMIADGMAGHFDLIVTKEISRFARNTMDSIYYTRKLKQAGIGVIFMNDNINTLDPDAELRLTILSSIAQEESRKTSDRVKWGQKRSMEQGNVFGSNLLGYRIQNKRLIIDEAEAKTVRLIFDKFVREGKGSHRIAKELEEAGILTAAGGSSWSNTAVLRILRNEKYCGDLVQKKTFTPNYLDHKKKVNRGEEEMVTLQNHHPPIIDRELFEAAAAELKKRSPAVEVKKKYSNRYCFSGKIKCQSCGCSYVARAKKRKDGSDYRIWRCYEAVRNGKQAECPGVSLNELALQETLMEIFREIQPDSNRIRAQVVSGLTKSLKECSGNDRQKLKREVDRLEKKLDELIELYLEEEITKDEFERLRNKYQLQQSRVRQQLSDGALDLTQKDAAARLAVINDKISALFAGTCWDDSFYRHLLERVDCFGDGCIQLCWKDLPGSWTYRYEE